MSVLLGVDNSELVEMLQADQVEEEIKRGSRRKRQRRGGRLWMQAE